MRILLASTTAIAVPTLLALAQEHQLVGVITQPDRPVGRHRQLTPSPIKKVAREQLGDLPVFEPEKLRDSLLHQQLEELVPEVLVTFSYGKIIPPQLLELPSLAPLNIHPSLLPKYRGPSPIQTAIWKGEEVTGITIMYMDEGLDTGDLLLQETFPILEGETSGELTERLAVAIPPILLKALSLLEKGKAPKITQDHQVATHTKLITREDALLDWQKPAGELEQLVRAMNPAPGAHGELQLTDQGEGDATKKRAVIPIKLYRVKTLIPPLLAAKGDSPLAPGTFFLSAEKQPLISTQEGCLLIQEIQPVGKRRMSGEEFARGLYKSQIKIMLV